MTENLVSLANVFMFTDKEYTNSNLHNDSSFQDAILSANKDKVHAIRFHEILALCQIKDHVMWTRYLDNA